MAESIGGTAGGRGGGRPRAVIAGAGIAGQAAALALHAAGWDPLVVERAPGRRSSGYMVNLSGAGIRAADRLGILPALRRADLGAFGSAMVRADGRVRFAIPAGVAASAVGDMVTVFRGDLEAALYEQLQDRAEVRFGTTVRRVVPDGDRVRAVLGDGTAVDAGLVVGADGLHSQLRADVAGSAGEPVVDMGHMVAAVPLDPPPPGVPENESRSFIGAGRSASVVNLGPGRSSAFFAYRCPDTAAELRHGPAEALAAAYGDLGGAVPGVLDQVGAGSGPVYFDSAAQVVLDRWSAGRTVLLGDAAWCVTVFAGHGAALALEGAQRLGEALSDPRADPAPALAEWESGLRPGAARRQALARTGMAQFAPPTAFRAWAGSVAARAMLAPGIRGLVQRSIARSRA